jgi:hypothetical protein
VLAEGGNSDLCSLMIVHVSQHMSRIRLNSAAVTGMIAAMPWSASLMSQSVLA